MKLSVMVFGWDIKACYLVQNILVSGSTFLSTREYMLLGRVT